MWIGSLSNNDGLKSEVALLQTLSRLFSLIRQNLAIFSELNSKRLYRSSEKEEESSLPCRFTSSTKREIRHFSSYSRAVTRECTKKRDVRAEFLFFQSKLVAFLPFSLTSQSSLLKLLYDKLRRPHCSFSFLLHYIVSSIEVAEFCLLLASIINEVSLSTKGSSCKQDQARGADRRIGR